MEFAGDELDASILKQIRGDERLKSQAGTLSWEDRALNVSLVFQILDICKWIRFNWKNTASRYGLIITNKQKWNLNHNQDET